MTAVTFATCATRAGAQDATSEASSREIVVHGSRLPERSSRRDPAAASTLVPGERLRAPGGSAAEAIAAVPGVRIRRRGATSELATASIRGSTSAQTPVYLGGIRLNDDVTGTADLSTVPVWMLDRAEVFRGTAPDSADQLGIGGAVFFEPRQIREPRVGAGLTVGSFGEDGQWIAGALGDGKSGALLALRHAQVDNDFSFRDDSGTARTRENADARTFDGWFVGRYDLGDGARLSAVANAFDREQGSPGLALTPATRARTRTQRLVGALSSRLPCGRDEAGENCHVDLDESLLTSRITVVDPARELSTTSTETRVAGERLSERASVWLAPHPDFETRLGTRLVLERIQVDQDGTATTRARRVSTRPTASVLLRPAAPVDVVALSALECQATREDGAAAGCDVLQPVGRLGGVLRLGRAWSLRGNVARTVRVPTLGELFGFSAVVRGNADLAVESSVSADAGMRFSPGRRLGVFDFYADGFVFARWAEDLIAFRRSALGVIRPFNVGTARFLGAELLAAARAYGIVGNETSLTLLDPRDTTGTPGNDLLPFQSRLVLANRTDTTWHLDHAALDSASVAAELRHRASQFADQAGLVVIAAQTTLDLEATTRWFDERLGFAVAIRNVTGARQFDTVGLPLPGRTLSLSAEAWVW